MACLPTKLAVEYVRACVLVCLFAQKKLICSVSKKKSREYLVIESFLFFFGIVVDAAVINDEHWHFSCVMFARTGKIVLRNGERV